MTMKSLGMSAIGLGLWMAGAACGTSSCFVRGTRVVTPKGFRRIEDLAVGDEVYSLDVEARRPVVRKVERLLRAESTELMHIAVGELVLVGVTPEHPFYDAEAREWVPASKIRAGSRMIAWLGSADVREIEVTKAIEAHPTRKVEVFNLTIEGPEHNYFAEGVLVHNKDIATGSGSTPHQGDPCATEADCGEDQSLYCETMTDGMCNITSKTCEIFPASCGESTMRTLCGCDGKPHAVGSCPGSKEILIDTRPNSCAPPAGQFNCGESTCALNQQYCFEGFAEVKCMDLPAACAADATCTCLMTAGAAACACNEEMGGGLRVMESL